MDTKEWEDLDRKELRIMGAWFWLTVVMVIVGFFLFSPAFAAPVFKSTGNDDKPMSLRLLDKPCTNSKVLAAINEKARPELRARFKEAQLLYSGKMWASCWIEMNEIVYSIDEEGAPLQAIPRFLFQEDVI